MKSELQKDSLLVYNKREWKVREGDILINVINKKYPSYQFHFCYLSIFFSYEEFPGLK